MSLRAVYMGGKLFSWSLARLAHPPTLASRHVDFNPRLFYDNEIKKNKIAENRNLTSSA